MPVSPVNGTGAPFPFSIVALRSPHGNPAFVHILSPYEPGGGNASPFTGFTRIRQVVYGLNAHRVKRGER